jgi:vacuolar-type H+-ATPase subunit E/Vma4
MDIKKTVKDTIDNARDTANEVRHRSTADAEHARRDLAGHEMTLGEKATSVANEVKNRTQAEIDKAKREVRGNT